MAQWLIGRDKHRIERQSRRCAQPAPHNTGAGRLAFALPAEQEIALLPGNLAAMADQETGGAGELVLLGRDNPDQEFFAGKIRTGKVNALSRVGVLDIDRS